MGYFTLSRLEGTAPVPTSEAPLKASVTSGFLY